MLSLPLEIPRLFVRSLSRPCRCPTWVSVRHKNLTSATNQPGNRHNIQIFPHLPQLESYLRWKWEKGFYECYGLLGIVQHIWLHICRNKSVEELKSTAVNGCWKNIWPEKVNPLEKTAVCETGWAIDAFAVNSSVLSVDGMTCLILFESWRIDISNGISRIQIVSIFRL
jgi:hypothetical protein